MTQKKVKLFKKGEDVMQDISQSGKATKQENIFNLVEPFSSKFLICNSLYFFLHQVGSFDFLYFG